MRGYTREELLALTPEVFLASGYLDADGVMRREYQSDYATAMGMQFLVAQLSPQELSLTVEAVRQILPMQEGTPGELAQDTADEALGVVAHAIRQPNNEVLATWLQDCAAAVVTEADLVAFQAHLLATERQYSLVAPLSQQASPAPGSPPAPAG